MSLHMTAYAAMALFVTLMFMTSDASRVSSSEPLASEAALETGGSLSSFRSPELSGQDVTLMSASSREILGLDDYVPLAKNAIIPLADFSALRYKIRPGDRIYLELDDTLFVPEPDSSPRFEKAMKSALEANGVSADSSMPATIELWQGLQGSANVQTVEGTQTVEVLRSLRDRGIELVGLTARSPALIKETAANLEQCMLSGIFEDSSLGEIEQPKAGDTRGPLVHDHGVIFTTNRKLQALLAYERLRPRKSTSTESPNRIVVVDDAMHQLEAIQKGPLPPGLDFLGFHYTALSEERYELPRLGSLLAGMLSSPNGRKHLTKAIAALDAADMK